MFVRCKNKIVTELNKYSYLKKAFFLFFIIYLLCLFPIIRANFNYIDDLGRVMYGYSGWTDFSRYTSTILSYFINTDTYLTDISPLPQLIAVLFLSLASIILLHTFTNNKKITLWNILAILPIGLCPYFLECLSYKYDAPHMALSILASVFPLLFIDKNKRLFSIITIISAIIMCTTYQASSGIFPILIIFYSFYTWCRNEKSNKDILKDLLISALSFIVGMIIFKVFLMRPIPGDTYVSIKLSNLMSLIPNFFSNLLKYYSLVITDFRKLWLLLLGIIILSFIIVCLFTSQKNKVLTFIITIITLLLSFILSFGVYPLLDKPLFFPRAMYGIGIIIALMCLIIANSSKFNILKLFYCALVWSFISFAFTYGNALAEQKRYTDFRVQLVINDLNNLEIMNNGLVKLVQLEGNIGKSPIIDNMPDKYKMINRLVPSTFGGSWAWNIQYFYTYFKIPNIYIDYDKDLKEINLPLLKDTMYHQIFGNDNNILIVLK